MSYILIRRLLHYSILLAAIVIGLGAFTRLTDAGLGCPDWPGCYGRWAVPKSAQVNQAQFYLQDGMISQTKAWTEMVHRYAAGALGLLILILVGGILSKSAIKLSTKALCVFLLFCVALQALLGMWTVTWQLLPIVVMGHLLGGMLIISLLWYLRLRLFDNRSPNDLTMLVPLMRYKSQFMLVLTFLIIQIVLGGWVSANYSALSCVGFPMCNGIWWPQTDIVGAFQWLSPVGVNYEGGQLDSISRVTIHMMHRIGAVITAMIIVLLAIRLWVQKKSQIQPQVALVLLLLIIQWTLGIINVTQYLPLSNALLHNITAVMLLLSVISLFFKTFCKKSYEN